MSLVSEFNDYRARMNERILAHDNKVIKRFWSLDNQTYQEGALDTRTKEMLGLVASMVLLMGIRPSEALLRLVRDIDDRGTRLRIREAKTRAGDRDPKIPDVLRKLIAARCEGKPRDALIFSTQDRTGRAIPRKADWVLDAVRRICKASGVPTICTYSLRGLHADLAIEAGTVPDVVAESLGHTSKEITMGHYAKPGTLADVTAQRAAQQLGVCDAPN